jgi:phosphatidylethanolamine-binding protein (PEBP) family uncharacterized protein
MKSTGAILASVLFAFLLALSGCGGGEGSDASTQSTTSSTQGGGGKQASSDPSSSKAKKPTSDPSKQESTNSSTSKAQKEGVKHGSHIAQPKGKRERAPSPSEVANSAVADISLESPNFITTASSEYELPTTYTCDGKNSPPTLKWSGVPAGSKELILFILGLQPIEETLFFNWAVAGLDPSLAEIPTGQLPTGAILGRNGYGKNAYSICPAKGQAETYVFALYALPQVLSPKRGFDPMSLRKEVLGISGDVGLVTASFER